MQVHCEEGEVDHWEHLVTIDEVEDLTGIDFFAELRDSEERRLERKQFTAIWE